MTAARRTAAVSARTEIDPGTPEEAYQAVNLAKMLWGFRLRDIDAWQSVIERWTSQDVPAWERIPEVGEAYGSPRRMIEAELEVDYDQFKEFIRIVLGQKYAAMIEKPLQDGPGGNNNPLGINQYVNGGQCYDHNIDHSPKARGTSQEYLRQRILKEDSAALDKIGKGREYKSVSDAAIKLGIIPEQPRLHVYADNPVAAGHYFAKRVDEEWMQVMMDAYEEARSEAQPGKSIKANWLT
jgi:hypothetical protein